MTEITDLDRAEARLREFNAVPNAYDGAITEVLAALDDARRWRALLSAARLRPQGWAGLDREGKLDPAATYVHFGMEFWTHHSHDADNAVGRQVLTSFAEMMMAGENPAAAAAAAKEDEDRQMMSAAIILGKACRKIIMVLPQVGLAEAIKLTDTPDMRQDRLISYLAGKGLLEQADEGPDVKLSEKGVKMRTYLLDVFDEAWAEGS